MTRKLVSVVTGTWQRHELLLEAIENVRQQTYRPLEHVIVSDGPDERLADMVDGLESEPMASRVPIIFQELGRNWSGMLTNSFAAVPFGVATWLARGEYLVWLADDERFLAPDAIEAMVDLLESEGVDFVYPRVELTWPNSTHREVIGSDPPAYGSVTHALHKVELLDCGGSFRTHIGRASDWDQFDRWMKAGKTWAMLDRVTLSHRVDN